MPTPHEMPATQVPAEPTPVPPPRGSRRRASLAAIVVLLVLAVGAFLFLRDSASDEVASVVATDPPVTSLRAGGVDEDSSATVVPTSDGGVQPDDTAVVSPSTSDLVTVTVPIDSVVPTSAPVVTQPVSTSIAVAATTTVVATTTTTTTSTTIFGDLVLADVGMTRPACDESYITIVGSAIGPDDYERIVQQVLDNYPGSQYLRTDQTCPSLRPELDGNPIYVGYFGPFVDVDDACSARSLGPPDAYVRVLSQTVASTHVIDCP